MSIERMAGPTGADAPVQPSPAPIGQRAKPAVAEAAAAAPQPADLKVAVDNLNRYLKSIDQSLRFKIDDETGKTVVSVVDEATGEVIRQMPNEETLMVARVLGRIQGLIFRQSA